jgi:transcriptional/translational regulatory protein YebC/TACO1
MDPDELEVDLIDHGLEEMLEGESDDGEPQLVIRCAFTELGNLQRALEERNITPASAGTEHICLNPIPLSEAEEQDVLKMVAELEQDDDVQRVFHALA